jgi:hypothetical protein
MKNYIKNSEAFIKLNEQNQTREGMDKASADVLRHCKDLYKLAYIIKATIHKNPDKIGDYSVLKDVNKQLYMLKNALHRFLREELPHLSKEEVGRIQRELDKKMAEMITEI